MEVGDESCAEPDQAGGHDARRAPDVAAAHVLLEFGKGVHETTLGGLTPELSGGTPTPWHVHFIDHRRSNEVLGRSLRKPRYDLLLEWL